MPTLFAKKGCLKGSFCCTKADRDSFKISRAQLTVSVGQPQHEGERLEATIAIINKDPFSEVIIMLDDSLQWRSLKIDSPDLTDDEAIKLAIENGNKWLERNFPTYNKLKVPYQIIRWKDWLSTQEYTKAVDFATAVYNAGPVFKAAIDANVATYLRRRTYLEPGSHDFLRAEDLCRQYSIEEAGVMAKLWTLPPLACKYEIYPSKRNEAMSAIFELYIKNNFPDILFPISLRFNRKSLPESTDLDAATQVSMSP